MKVANQLLERANGLWDRTPRWLAAIIFIWLVIAFAFHSGAAQMPKIGLGLQLFIVAPAMALVIFGIVMVAVNMIEILVWPVRKVANWLRKTRRG